jgi:hypothetical protein
VFVLQTTEFYILLKHFRSFAFRVSTVAQPPPSAVTANFPQPVLTPFATEFQPPTHSWLQVLQRELNANAMSVHSNEGGGTFGHLPHTISAADYTAIVGTIPFPPPPAPPAAPVYAVGATAKPSEKRYVCIRNRSDASNGITIPTTPLSASSSRLLWLRKSRPWMTWLSDTLTSPPYKC